MTNGMQKTKTYNYFIRLTFTDQLAAIWRDGKYIYSREEGEFVISLYKLNSFYAEVLYDTGAAKVEKIFCKTHIQGTTA